MSIALVIQQQALGQVAASRVHLILAERCVVGLGKVVPEGMAAKLEEAKAKVDTAAEQLEQIGLILGQAYNS